MTATSVQRFYRLHAHVYDWTRWIFLFGRRDAATRLEPRPDGAYLEVGCGTGLNFTPVARTLSGDAGRLVGLDFSVDMLRKARSRARSRGWTHVSLVAADAARLTLRRTFDGILFSYSLTMIPDWRAALDRAHAHLRPGGRLVVVDFGAFEGWGPLKMPWRAWMDWHHVATREPYEEKLRALFPDLSIRRRLGDMYFTAVGTQGS